MRRFVWLDFQVIINCYNRMHCALLQEITSSFMQQTILANNFLQQTILARSFMQGTILARSFMQGTILARSFMPHQLWRRDLANLATGTYIKVLVHVGLVAVSLRQVWVGGCVCKFFSCIIWLNYLPWLWVEMHTSRLQRLHKVCQWWACAESCHEQAPGWAPQQTQIQLPLSPTVSTLSSVQPPCQEAKKHTHTHTHTKLKLKWNAHWQNRV